MSGGKNIAQFHSRNSRDLRAKVGMRSRYNPLHINHATKPESFRPKTSATALLCPTEDSWPLGRLQGRTRRVDVQTPMTFCRGDVLEKIVGLRAYRADDGFPFDDVSAIHVHCAVSYVHCPRVQANVDFTSAHFAKGKRTERRRVSGCCELPKKTPRTKAVRSRCCRVTASSRPASTLAWATSNKRTSTIILWVTRTSSMRNACYQIPPTWSQPQDGNGKSG